MSEIVAVLLAASLAANLLAWVRLRYWTRRANEERRLLEELLDERREPDPILEWSEADE